MAAASAPDYSSLLSKIESKLAPPNPPSKKQIAERSLTADDKRSVDSEPHSMKPQTNERSSYSMGPARSPLNSYPQTQLGTIIPRSPIQDRSADIKSSLKSETFGERDFRFPGLSGLVADTIAGLGKADPTLPEKSKPRTSTGLPPAPRSPIDPSTRFGLLSFTDATHPSILSPQQATTCPPYQHTAYPKPQSSHHQQQQKQRASSQHSAHQPSATNLGLLGETEQTASLHEFHSNAQTPTAQFVSQTLLPLVMDNVRRCWQQFRKEVVQEVRREFAMCSSLKMQECLEEVQRVQTAVSRNKEDCLRAIERKADEIKREYHNSHEQLKGAYQALLAEVQGMKSSYNKASAKLQASLLDTSVNKENLSWGMNSNITPNQSREVFRHLDLNSKESIANASLYIEARRDQENKIKDFLKGMRLKSNRNDPDLAPDFDHKHPTSHHNYFLKPTLGAPPRTQKLQKEIRLKRSVLDNDCLNITAPSNLEIGGRGYHKAPHRRMSIDTAGGRSKSDSREELKASHRNRSKKVTSTKANTSGVSSNKRTVLADYHNNSSLGANHSAQYNTSTTTAKSRERFHKRA